MSLDIVTEEELLFVYLGWQLFSLAFPNSEWYLLTVLTILRQFVSFIYNKTLANDNSYAV